jgi:hypothetical protein
MYPYVIPFSGSALARDPSLAPHVEYARREVAGTDISWQQPAKILPIDPIATDAILRLERSFEMALQSLENDVAHLPSRVRSLLWILCSLPIMAELGEPIAAEAEVLAELTARLPSLRHTVSPTAAATA